MGAIVAEAKKKIPFGPEIRRAELYTEFTVGGQSISVKLEGARSCAVQANALSAARGTEVFKLQCDLTYFGGKSPLGDVHVFQDPRIENFGWIFLRRNAKGDYDLPALSFFNQYLIFHIGDRYLYYPKAWQVVSAIDVWPPEHYQYHHLEEDTPVFDLISRTPNVARKGISTISIEGSLNSSEEKAVRAAQAREIELFNKLPASKMTPENLGRGVQAPE